MSRVGFASRALGQNLDRHVFQSAATLVELVSLDRGLGGTR